MSVRFTAFDREYAECQDEILHAIDRCGRGGRLILGEEVERFEQAVAERANHTWAVAVGSGYDALYLALRLVAQRTGKHGFVAMPAYRHVSADNAAINAGFVPTTLEPYRATLRWYGYGPTAYMPVHMEGIVGQPIKTDIPVVEDACQAFGADGLGRADLTCFSFHPMKVLGCMGDGGAIAGSDLELRTRLLELRHHGERGVNSRLDAVQAATLNVKLKRLPAWLAHRTVKAHRYRRALGWCVQVPPTLDREVWSSYVIRRVGPEPSTLELQLWLEGMGIETKRPTPDRLALPLYPQLTDDEQQRVIDAIQAYFRGRAL